MAATRFFGKLNACDFAAKLFAEDFRCINNADTVRQNKCCTVDDAHIFSVPTAEINDFGIWRYHIALLPCADAAHCHIHSLLHCYCMEMHAQNRSGFHFLSPAFFIVIIEQWVLKIYLIIQQSLQNLKSMHTKSLFGTNADKKSGVSPDSLHIFPIFFLSLQQPHYQLFLLSKRRKGGTQPLAASPYTLIRSVRG